MKKQDSASFVLLLLFLAFSTWSASAHEGEAHETDAEEEITHDQCRDRLRDVYPVADLAQRLDVELPQTPNELRTCVERDLARMMDPFPVGWCDNVFKIHCGALGVLTELGEALADRCETAVEEKLEIEPDAEGIRCLRDRTYELFTGEGVVTEGAACVELFESDCTTAETQSEEIAGTWPESGPDILWRRPLGDGYSGLLHDDGRLYTMLRIDKERYDQETVVALDAATGRTIWETTYEHPEYEQQRGYGSGPRATPALAGGRLFTAGITGTLVALDAEDGDVVWRRELLGEELAGNVLSHGYSSSPLAWGDLVILPVGGPDAGLVAFDQASGRTAWTSTDLRNSFSSPTLVRMAGREQVLTFMADELVSVDPASGDVLWRFPHTNSWRHNISLPLATADDRLFLSSPEAGARGVRVVQEGESLRVVEEWANRRMQLFHTTAVASDEWVYGSSGVTSPAFLTAIDADTGDIAWKIRGFAKANVVAAGDRLLILDEDGRLALASPTPEGLDFEAETQLFDGIAWTAPTLVGSTLYARNLQEIVALALG